MTKPALIPEIYVTDYGVSLSFYINVLGFDVLYKREAEKFAMLGRQGAQIMLEEIGITRNWITDTLERPFGRGVNFQIETTDIQTLYRKVIENKISLFLDLEEKWYRTDSGHAGNKQFIIQDPDGYLLRFFEDLGNK